MLMIFFLPRCEQAGDPFKRAVRLQTAMDGLAGMSKSSWRRAFPPRAVATALLQLSAEVRQHATEANCGRECAVPADSEALGTPSTSRVDVPGRMSASRGRNGSISLYLSYCPPTAGLGGWRRHCVSNSS